jgi:two-component system, NtrC family, response regulator
MANLLVIDDDIAILKMLRQMIFRLGYHADTAQCLSDGLKLAAKNAYDIVLLDVNLPDGNGLEYLPKFSNYPAHPEVIILTGFGDPDGAELAIKGGAWDYIEKPFSQSKLALALKRAVNYRLSKSQYMSTPSFNHEPIVVNCREMEKCISAAAEAATSDINVLITGETGTGKELLAHAIHRNSPRVDKNFVVVDCAALPETIVESVLFGHKKGSFTGADHDQEGLIQQADEGTLFLDELGELPRAIQKSFLRFLQERSFRPVGAKKEITSNFRLIAATNRNMDDLVASGKFRNDLFFRIRSLVIEIPPLRERKEAIKEIVNHHLHKLCEQRKIAMKDISPEFWEALESYSWPGNVRELIHVLESAFIKAQRNPVLLPVHLSKEIRIHHARKSIPRSKSLSKNNKKELLSFKASRQISVAGFEEGYLQDLLAATNGNIPDACIVSGLSRARLYALLNKHHIKTK